MLHFLTGVFFPHQHNNHKAKILHQTSLIVLLGILIMAQSVLTIVKDLKPGVLGYAAYINPQEVVDLTNKQRVSVGLPKLRLDPILTTAAQSKAADMISRGYWAHNTPDGKEPWYFISGAGYKYLHAGENLARDFSSASSAVDAWMKSDSHRANLLNGNYTDIGVAIVEGKVNGIDTTIVVQMFGKPLVSTPSVASSKTSAIREAFASQPISDKIVVSPLDLSRSISLAFLILIITTLAFDWFIIWRRNIIRLTGKNWAHLTYFATLAVVLLLIKQGWVL